MVVGAFFSHGSVLAIAVRVEEGKAVERWESGNEHAIDKRFGGVGG